MKYLRTLLRKSTRDSGANFSWKTILQSIFWIHKFKWRKNAISNAINQNKLFQIGWDKFNSEIDLISILNSIRRANVLVDVLLSEKQQAMLRYQKNCLIDCQSETTQVNNQEKREIQRHLDIDIFSDLNDENHQERNIDKILLEGMFVKEEWDLSKVNNEIPHFKDDEGIGVW